MADILHRNPRGTAAAWASPRALTAVVCRPPSRRSAPASSAAALVGSGKRTHARESRKGPELAACTLLVPARPPILGPTMADKLLSPTSAPGRPDLPLSSLTSTHTSQCLPHSRHGLGLRPRTTRHRRWEGAENQDAPLHFRRMRSTVSVWGSVVSLEATEHLSGKAVEAAEHLSCKAGAGCRSMLAVWVGLVSLGKK